MRQFHSLTLQCDQSQTYLFGAEEDKRPVSEETFAFRPLAQVHLVFIQAGLVNIRAEATPPGEEG